MYMQCTCTITKCAFHIPTDLPVTLTTAERDPVLLTMSSLHVMVAPLLSDVTDSTVAIDTIVEEPCLSAVSLNIPRVAVTSTLSTL